MKKITLTTKEDLDIYMSPMRHKLLHQLDIAKAPMTPKMLADRLKISASGVQHHIKKLMLLNLIELHHTEIINGIKASFYNPTRVTVQIGLNKSDGLGQQREVLIQNSIAQVYDGFSEQMKKRISSQGDKRPDSIQKWGDILTGVAHLSPNESCELIKLISAFLEQHSAPTDDSNPWEYAIIAYNAEAIGND